MDFANTVVSHDTHSVMSLMAHLHNMAAPEAARRAAARDADDMVCSLIHSLSHFNIIYKSIAQKLLYKLKWSSWQSISALNDPRFLYHVNERVTRKMILKEKLVTENMDDSMRPEKLSFRPSLFRMLQDALKVSLHSQCI